MTQSTSTPSLVKRLRKPGAKPGLYDWVPIV